MSETESGRSLADAIEFWSDSELWRNFERLRQQTKGKGIVTSSKYLTAPLDSRATAADSDNRLIAERDGIHHQLIRQFMARLSSGDLAATGIEYPLKLDSKPIPIGSELWRHLRPNFTDSSAEGNGLKLIDIRVTKGIAGNLPQAPEDRGGRALDG